MSSERLLLLIALILCCCPCKILSSIIPRPQSLHQPSTFQKQGADLNSMADGEILAKLRQEFRKKGYSGVVSLKKGFNLMDKDGSSTLTKDEMKTKVGDVQLTEEEAGTLYQAFDTDGHKGISYKEFMLMLIPDTIKERERVIDEVYSLLDQNGDGAVEVSEIKGNYDTSTHPGVQKGEITEDELLRRILEMLESSGKTDGKVTREEFHEFYAGLTRTIDANQYFMSIIKKKWPNAYKNTEQIA